jgi:ATP-dependent DNA helicase RecG
MESNPSHLDINRLQQALTVEAEKGFTNLQGRQFLFADFLSQSLSQSLPPVWDGSDRIQAQTLSNQYAKYSDLPLSQRQHLIAETRRLLYDVRRREISGSSAPQIAKKPKTEILVKQTTKQTATKPASGSSSSTQAAIAKPLSLDLSLQYLEGIGPKIAEKLTRLDLYTVEDVLNYFPRDHIDYARQVEIKNLNDGDTVTIIGTIRRYTCFTSPKNPNLTIVEIILRDLTGQIKLNRFWAGKRYSNRGWQEQQKRLYPQGATVAASGVVKRGKYGLTLEDYDLEVLDHSQDRIESNTIGRVVPVYPLTEGISPELIRRVVIQCLPIAHKISDPIPEKLRKDYQLIGLAEAIAQVHYPDDSDRLEAAIVRLTFDKYFYRRLVSLYRRNQQKAIQFVPRSQLIEKLEGILPFELTGAQKRSISEIRADLQGTTPMNRLVQGDVGSGKTIVAVYALLAAIESGFQAALMAPTEVLAEQHYRKIVEWFNLLYIPVELLTGSTRTAKRRETLRQLETGELPLIIGTHALIQDTVNFCRLGLAVIDEQHRFGRDQRSRLLQKGEDPHVLIMTATPIPRTLYLTNSEIEVSIIDELPPGRKPIQTTLLKPSQRKEAYELMRREIAQGRQIYIVFPLVEESDKMEDVKAAIQEREHLQSVVFPNFKIGLLHGQMTSSEKDEAINQFRRCETEILVATTVVEVGVDIPNASVMLIEHADRFGLAQLHQLRGRVGRGSSQSYCLLMSNAKSETAQERLKVLEQSQDGFFIAERDFQLRGKGKDEGTEQSGHAGFSIEDRLSDEAKRLELFQIARVAAERLIKKDPTLVSFPQLKTEFDHHYQRLQGGAIFT